MQTQQDTISKKPSERHGVLPVDGNLPLIGALPDVLRDKLDHLIAARSTHGDIYTLNLGFSRMVALNHPRHAQHVLRDNVKNYSKGNPIWNSIRTLLGNGLPASEGDFWRRQRRLIQPQFHREKLNALANHMVDAIDETMASWEAYARSGEPMNIAVQLSQMTMRVIVKTMFGGQIDGSVADRIAAEFGYIIDYMFFGMATQKLPLWLPVPGRKRYRNGIQNIDDVIFRVIDDRKRAESEGSLVALLLDQVDAETGQRMTAKELRDEAVSIFLAGYETTAVAMAFAFHALTENSVILRNLQTEIDGVVGARRPTFSDVPELRETLMAVQEALRLYPPSYWIPRTAVQDDEIDGFPIPAGTEVSIMTYVIHRHPDIWTDPNRYDPQRFTPEQSAKRHSLAWMPFGAGQRLCVGKDFALMEAQLIMARILSQYNIEGIPNRQPKVHVSTSLRPGGGVWVRLSKRTPRAQE